LNASPQLQIKKSKMAITVLLGAQWGDEGKGRITDALASNADVVARFNGGDNAGHSVTIGTQVVRLHTIPSGIFRADCLCLIGNGVVLNPRTLLKEMAEVERAADITVSPKRMKISEASAPLNVVSVSPTWTKPRAPVCARAACTTRSASAMPSTSTW
jgi:adenylosuccinate synthase